MPPSRPSRTNRVRMSPPPFFLESSWVSNTRQMRTVGNLKCFFFSNGVLKCSFYLTVTTLRDPQKKHISRKTINKETRRTKEPSLLCKILLLNLTSSFSLIHRTFVGNLASLVRLRLPYPPSYGGYETLNESWWAS